jgi:uncharacterized protein HemY
LALAREIRDPWDIAGILRELGNLAMMQDDWSAAYDFLVEGVALARAAGGSGMTARLLASLGMVAYAQADYKRARSLLDESVVLARQTGSTFFIAPTLRALGYVLNRQGDIARAATLFQESLERCSTQGDKRGIAGCLAALAGWRADQQQLDGAACLFGAVDTLLNAMGIDLEPADHIEYRRHLAGPEQGRADAALASAWLRGSQMTLEQVLVFAAQELPGVLSAATRAADAVPVRQPLFQNLHSA